MVAVRLVAVRVVDVLATSSVVSQLSVDFCHFKMDPVYPERVSSVLLVPEHTVAEPSMLPPKLAGSMVICNTFDSCAPVQSAIQSTLAIRLYQVVAVKPAGGS